jgi:hypothetical protein
MDHHFVCHDAFRQSEWDKVKQVKRWALPEWKDVNPNRCSQRSSLIKDGRKEKM